MTWHSRVLTIIGVLAGCNGGSESNAPIPTEEPLFPSDFESTYREVRSCRFSIEHDGSSIIVYASPEAADAYLDGVYPFETGTVLVKKQHADANCMDFVETTAMKKKADGTWQWQRVLPDRSIDPAASPERCVGCHMGCTEGRDLACTDE